MATFGPLNDAERALVAERENWRAFLAYRERTGATFRCAARTLQAEERRLYGAAGRDTAARMRALGRAAADFLAAH